MCLSDPHIYGCRMGRRVDARQRVIASDLGWERLSYMFHYMYILAHVVQFALVFLDVRIGIGLGWVRWVRWWVGSTDNE